MTSTSYEMQHAVTRSALAVESAIQATLTSLRWALDNRSFDYAMSCARVLEGLSASLVRLSKASDA